MSAGMPPPRHLKACTIRVRSNTEPNRFVGRLACSCGGRRFRLLHTGATCEHGGEQIVAVAELKDGCFLRVRADCIKCNAHHLLFDKDFHGWDGFVCRRELGDYLRPRPRRWVPWACRRCGGLTHSATLLLTGDAQEQAIRESNGRLTSHNWQEGFGWIDINIRCSDCGHEPRCWLSYESM